MNVCNIIGNVAVYCSGFRYLLLHWQHFANLGFLDVFETIL
jgi:hypothetical protein